MAGWPLSTIFLHTTIRCTHPFFLNNILLHPFVLTEENIIYVGFIHNVVIPNVCVSKADVFNDFGTSFI